MVTKVKLNQKYTSLQDGKWVANRIEYPVDVVSESKKTLWVRLPDGHIVKRKRVRDVSIR